MGSFYIPTMQQIRHKESTGSTLSTLELYIKQHCPDDENKARAFMLDLGDLLKSLANADYSAIRKDGGIL